MVTVWGMNQLSGVKVRLDPDGVPSVASLELTGIVTFAVGRVVSTTRNDAPLLPSVVTSPVRSVTLTPAVGRTIAIARELTPVANVASVATFDPSRLARYSECVPVSIQYILPAT